MNLPGVADKILVVLEEFGFQLLPRVEIVGNPKVYKRLLVTDQVTTVVCVQKFADFHQIVRKVGLEQLDVELLFL